MTTVCNGELQETLFLAQLSAFVAPTRTPVLPVAALGV